MGDLVLTSTAAQAPGRIGATPSLRLLPTNLPMALARHPERETVLAECHLAIAQAEPAAPVEFARAYERLALHYPESSLATAEQRVVFADWRRLLADIPAELLNRAVDGYLLSPARFFPTPGQLAIGVRAQVAYRKGLAKWAQQTLDLIQAEDGAP